MARTRGTSKVGARGGSRRGSSLRNAANASADASDITSDITIRLRNSSFGGTASSVNAQVVSSRAESTGQSQESSLSVNNEPTALPQVYRWRDMPHHRHPRPSPQHIARVRQEFDESVRQVTCGDPHVITRVSCPTLFALSSYCGWRSDGTINYPAWLTLYIDGTLPPLPPIFAPWEVPDYPWEANVWFQDDPSVSGEEDAVSGDQGRSHSQTYGSAC